MPNQTTAISYHAATQRASTRREADLRNTPPQRPETDSPARPVRAYRAWLWDLAAWLKTLGIIGALLLAARTGWLGAAAIIATCVGLALRHVLEATSYGD